MNSVNRYYVCAIMNNNDVTRQILTEIQRNPRISQKSLAGQIGISVGMINWHIKRCVNKGFVKFQQAPARRYLYYLTPEGFSEKSRLTANFLRYSFDIYYKGQRQYKALLNLCIANDWNSVALIGDSELVDLLCLIKHECPEITFVAIVDTENTRKEHKSIPIFSDIEKLKESQIGRRIDAFIATHFLISSPDSIDCSKILNLFGLDNSRLLIPAFLQ